MASTLAPHAQSAAEVCTRRGAEPSNGLTAFEASRRGGEAGPNRIAEQKRISRLGTLASQFTDFVVLVLITAANVPALLGELADSIAIVTITVLNATLGFVQEYRTVLSAASHLILGSRRRNSATLME